MNKVKVSLIVVLAFILGIASSNAFTAFAHGGDTALIHACVKNSNGSIRIVGANTTCTSQETPLDWSASIGGTSGGGGVFSAYGVANAGLQCAAPNGGFSTGNCAEVNVPLPANGSLISLVVHPWSNTQVGGDPATVTVLVNGAPTALSVEIPDGSLATEIIYTDVVVQAGDLITVQSFDADGFSGDTRFTATFEYRTD